MEVLGAIVSISQLFNYLLVVSTSAADLYTALADAPKEYQVIKDQTNNVRRRLEEIKYLFDELSDDERLMSDQLRSLSKTTLSSVWQALIAVQRALAHKSKYNSLASRLHWVVVDQTTVRKCLISLESAEHGLASLLQILNLSSSRLINRKLDDNLLELEALRTDINALSQRGAVLLDYIQSKDQAFQRGGAILPLSQGDDYPRSEDSARPIKIVWKPTVLHSDLFCGIVRLFGINTTYTRLKHKTSSVSICLLLRIYLFQKAVLLRLKTRRLCWTSISLRDGYLRIANIVSLESSIVSACSHGETARVKQLLASGLATPNDVTSDGSSILYYAVKNGHREVAKVLIDYEADVNSRSGESQMTPLRKAFVDRNLEMSRLLINNGADLDELDIDGATIVEALWAYDQEPYTSQLDFIHLLTAKSFSDFTTADCDGWTALHWVASFGTAEDIKAMIRYGADPCASVRTFGCQALHFAAQYGNRSTMEELLRNVEAVDINARDWLGLTPLHIAVGNDDHGITQMLLDYGARTDVLKLPIE